MSPADDDTPRRLASRQRRRSTDGVVSRTKMLMAAVGLLATSGGTGYYTSLVAIGDRERSLLERVAKIETRQEEQYKALLQRVDDALRRIDGVGQDVNQTRGEIMGILRGSRP